VDDEKMITLQHAKRRSFIDLEEYSL